MYVGNCNGITAGPARGWFTSGASRAGLFSVVLGAHLLALLAVISIKSVALVVERAPMLVDLVPEPIPPKPPIPVRTVPLPQMVKPEVHVPEPPRFEVLQMVEVVEHPVPPPAPKVQLSRAAAPEAVSTEPPRFDLAYLNNPAPAYPVFAKRAREQGVVVLRVRVDAAGSVEGAELHKSSGFERLDKAALAAVRQWRFVPARHGDRSVAGIAIVPIHFQLET